MRPRGNAVSLFYERLCRLHIVASGGSDARIRAVGQMPDSQAGVQQVVVKRYAGQSVRCLTHKQAYSVLRYCKS